MKPNSGFTATSLPTKQRGPVFFRSTTQQSAYAELIINKDQEFWLYRENLYQSKGRLNSAAGATMRGKFETQMVSGNTLQVIRLDKEAIELREFLSDGSLSSVTPMRRADAPRFPPVMPSHPEVEFIGNFDVKFDDNGKDFFHEEVWLWRTKNTFWGLHERVRYTRGETSWFNQPEKIDIAYSNPNNEAVLRFKTRFGTALLTPSGTNSWRMKYESNPQEPIRILQRGQYGPNYAFDLAPLHTKEVNQRWLETMNLTYHTVWKVPEAIELRTY